MTRATRALAAGLALASSACVHTLAAPPRRPHAAAPAPAAVDAVFEPPDPRLGNAGLPHRDLLPGDVLRERLAARGIEVAGGTAAPKRAQIHAWLAGSERTALTRWLLPWGLVHVLTVGIVPYRDATEFFVEVHAADPAGPPGQKTRISRKSYTVASWGWLFLLVARKAGGREDILAVHREGLARALDEALDEVLAPP